MFFGGVCFLPSSDTHSGSGGDLPPSHAGTETRSSFRSRESGHMSSAAPRLARPTLLPMPSVINTGISLFFLCNLAKAPSSLLIWLDCPNGASSIGWGFDKYGVFLLHGVRKCFSHCECNELVNLVVINHPQRRLCVRCFTFAQVGRSSLSFLVFVVRASGRSSQFTT